MLTPLNMSTAIAASFWTGGRNIIQINHIEKRRDGITHMEVKEGCIRRDLYMGEGTLVMTGRNSWKPINLTSMQHFLVRQPWVIMSDSIPARALEVRSSDHVRTIDVGGNTQAGAIGALA